MSSLTLRAALIGCALVTLAAPGALALADDPFADEVVSYIPGDGATPGFTDPSTALGSPERFTGEGVFPGSVTPFNPCFGLDEIVSLGAGGSLTLHFNTPVRDDPANPYGIDLIIFNNTGFIDGDYPNGIVAGMFGDDGGQVEVSADGVVWVAVRGAIADGPLPTQGYLDNTGPFDELPGTVLSNFTLPADPSVGVSSLTGLSYADVVTAYQGSGGGVGIDIAATGLAAISFVRITNPDDATGTPEIDAVADAKNPADFNDDGAVGAADLAQLLAVWGETLSDAPEDLNHDGIVGAADLALLLANWVSN